MNEWGNNASQESRNPTLPEIKEEEQLMENMKRLNPRGKEILKTMMGKLYNYLQPKKEEHDER